MDESLELQANHPPALLFAAGQDRFGEYRGLGISSIAFKVTVPGSNGLLIVENTFREKGGPAATPALPPR